MFEELLIPTSQFYFQKRQLFEKRYISLDDSFELRQHISGKTSYWNWVVLPNVNWVMSSGLKQNFTGGSIGLKFKTWREARDDVLKTLKVAFPEKDFTSKVKQYQRNIYFLRHSSYVNMSFLCLKRENSGWGIYDHPSKYLSTRLLPEIYSTRQQALKALYQHVVENIDDLYSYADKKSYPLDFVNSEGFWDINLWWLLFVKPEINLRKIFL